MKRIDFMGNNIEVERHPENFTPELSDLIKENTGKDAILLKRKKYYIVACDDVIII